MSNAITPIDAIDVQRTVLIEEEDQKREAQVRQLSNDQSKRAQNETAALAIRLARLRGQDQALSNIKDTLNVSAAAKAAIGDSAEILARLKDLALQSTSETLSAAERATIQIQFDTLKIELDRRTTAAENDRASTRQATVVEANPSLTANATASPASTDLAPAGTGSDGTDAAARTSSLAHDLIVDRTEVSVLAQSNQDPADALKLLDEG